jgi:nucleoside 2-deoxyribosyltransferase
MTKIYLAGPMSICPEDFNFPNFFRVTEILRREGHDVFSPAENDLRKYGSLENTKLFANYRDCLKDDLNWIIDHAEALYVLKGWEPSKGVAAELALAKALKLPVYFEPEKVPQ